jgi:23S rRNA (cytidine1920-2'-O)/16S rRNA (cytidine1409-2'-O)-methyltransferase
MKRTTLLQRLKELQPGAPEKELFARILCGEITVDGATVRFPRQPVSADAVIGSSPRRRFVSRGGEKLDAVLERWRVDVGGLCLLDAGASTGGFTDCLLQRGASCVVAVEKGFNQLDFRLRQDPRVAVLEKTSIMDLTPQMLPVPVEAAVADLSLRSLRRAAAHILSLIPDGWLIALVKPQYERTCGKAGRQAPDSAGAAPGVVRSRGEALRALRSLVLALEEEGLAVIRGATSTVAGAKGNREFFFEIRSGGAARQKAREGSGVLEALEELVAEAFPG